MLGNQDPGWFVEPMFRQGPGYTVDGQEQCRFWVHLFVCYEYSRRLLPQSHCMAASFVHVRDSRSAKGNLWEQKPNFVLRQSLCRKDLSELINSTLAWRLEWDVHEAAYLSPTAAKNCRGAKLSSFGGCSNSPGVSSKATHTSLLTACIVS